MSRNSHQTDSHHYSDWLSKANADLKSALALQNIEGCEQNSAFHCQQCIEKALKAYLLFKKGEHFDGHNLTFLCKMATREDENFGQWLDESAYLNRYYIETRYPSDFPLIISEQKLSNIVGVAQNTYNFIENEINKKEL